jgi:CheY-like chemotaxis protein
MRLAPPLSTRPLRTLGKVQSAGSFQGAKSAPFLMLGNMPPKIRALLVMARERLPLLDALESCGIEVVPVCDCNEARRMLETQAHVQVVFTDTALPDGTWRQVLKIVTQVSSNIEVVVCSLFSDCKLWLDVLEEGGYDVLVQPYQRDEIKRIVEAAGARAVCSISGGYRLAGFHSASFLTRPARPDNSRVNYASASTGESPPDAIRPPSLVSQ